MNITIRDHVTGEAIRSWDQPSNVNGKTPGDIANEYAVGEHGKVIAITTEHGPSLNVFVIRED